MLFDNNNNNVRSNVLLP